MRTVIAIATALVVLVAAGPASAKPVRGLHISGMRPVYWTWAQEASKNVPLPDARISLWRGDPEYLPELKMMFLPWPGHDNWTALYVQGLFLHELGHVYDYSNMTPARRIAFKNVAGIQACSWWARYCWTERWVSGPGVMVNLSPGEMFAEAYMACALGMTRPEVEAVGYLTYGWVPAAGTDAKLCDVIRGR